MSGRSATCAPHRAASSTLLPPSRARTKRMPASPTAAGGGCGAPTDSESSNPADRVRNFINQYGQIFKGRSTASARPSSAPPPGDSTPISTAAQAFGAARIRPITGRDGSDRRRPGLRADSSGTTRVGGTTGLGRRLMAPTTRSFSSRFPRKHASRPSARRRRDCFYRLSAASALRREPGNEG